MKKFLFFVPLLLLAACGPDPTMPMKTNTSVVQKQQVNSRVVVERIGIFEDDVAYNNRRGVYLIKDSETGQEFIGISGVGISELGSHSSGKSRVSDER